MKILYRVCATLSDKQPAVDWDKYTMIKKCFESLMIAGAKPEDVTVLYDRLPKPWLEELFPKAVEKVPGPAGNVPSFHNQLKLASMYEGKVLLLEDDYIWRPDTIRHLERALDELEFVSPYDHPRYYVEDRFPKEFELRLIDGLVYRDSPSNTLTFASTGKKITEHLETMFTYYDGDQPIDHEMWQELALAGDRIWNPTYSFATHLVGGLLAPNVEWDLMV